MAFKFNYEIYKNQDLIKFENKIRSNLSLKADYDTSASQTRFLLIEGSTDKNFFQDYINYDVKMVTASSIVNGNKIIMSDGTQKDESCKNFIKAICLGVDFDSKCGNQKGYQVTGVVDRDFEEEFPTAKYNKVLSNDTHDLETMMLSTQKGLIEEVIPLNQEIKKEIYFKAYQLGLVKYALFNYKDRINYSFTRDKMKFDEFFDKKYLNIEKYLNFLNKQNKILKEKIYGNKDLKIILTNIYKFNKLYINDKGQWKIKFENFDLTCLPEDFYFYINGHDLCDLIAYYFKNIKNDFSNQLVFKYQKSNFQNSTLYDKMKKHKLID